MKINRTSKKPETRLKSSKEKAWKAFRVYAAAVITVALTAVCGITAFATDDPITVVDNLSDFIFTFIRAIGIIIAGFGFVELGLSLKSHDPSQRANGFLSVGAGVIIMFAKEILDLITGA